MFSKLASGSGKKTVARAHNISVMTLKRYKSGNVTTAKKLGPKPFLGSSGEKQLCDWITRNERAGMCVTVDQITTVLTRICKHLNLVAVKSGKKWFELFLKRHPELAKRRTDLMARSRVSSVTEMVLSKWYLRAYPLVTGRDPSKIWNCDEGGRDLTQLFNRTVGVMHTR